jgi:heat shock protein HslJ
LVAPSAPRLAKPLVAPSAPAEDWQPLTDMATLTGVTFRLALIDTQEFPGQEAAPSLSFAPGPRLVGELCNRFTGEVEWRDGVLRGNLAMTRRFCLNPDLNRAEQLLSDLLGRGARLEVAPGGRLRLRGDGGILTYRAEPGAPGTALPW